MLKIRVISYKIRFLEDINFKEEPEIAFLKAIYRRLKSFLCICKQEKCMECKYKSKCLYNFISAGDFEFIENMPIVIDRPLLSKRRRKKGDVLFLKFHFLGDAYHHIDFINYVIKEFEMRGLFKERYRFFIEDRTDDYIVPTKNRQSIKSIKILTPIDRNENIFEKEKRKFDNLNKLYNFTDETIDPIDEQYEFNAIKFKINKALHIGSNVLMQKGYVGTIKFRDPVLGNSLLNLIKIIGAGRFYGIGGGRILEVR